MFYHSTLLYYYFDIMMIIESESSEGCEGSIEAREYSKQNTNVRSDNNIQNSYKKLYDNATKSNNITLKWIMKRLRLLRSLHSLHSLHHSQTLK